MNTKQTAALTAEPDLAPVVQLADLPRLREVPTTALPADRAPITAIITTLNEEDDIVACLESLSWCDEVLVVDSYSSDQTVALAQSFTKVRVMQRTYYGAAAQKNWAIDRARHEWILILDADERVTPELRQEIEQVLAAESPADALTIRRKTLFLGREIRFSGWQHDQVVRMFRRGAARYPNRRVHADMQTRAPAGALRSHLVHHMVEDFREYTERMQRYAYWGAAQLWKEQRRAGAYEVLARSAWRFVRTYLLQAGFRDGMVGLVFCLIQSYGTFLKWATLWSWQADQDRGRKPALPPFDESEQTWAWPEPVV